MSIVPVAWDDTRLISGDIDDHAILARRKGDDWYLGGIHAADTSIEYSFDLDFLEPEVSYEMVLIEQGENESSFERSTRTVNSGDPLAVTLPVYGGFVATFVAR